MPNAETKKTSTTTAKDAQSTTRPRRGGRRTAKKVSGTDTTAKNAPSAPSSPSSVNRDELGEKTRVHALAKQLGMTSKDLVVALDKVGLVKVAQSTLTKNEVIRLLDHLEGNAQPAGEDADAPETATSQDSAAEKTSDIAQDDGGEEDADKQEDDRLRHRVRKNVANEIHQIEEKVDADLAEEVEKAADSSDDDLLQDVTPEITPAPDEAPAAAALAPVFVAPEKATASPQTPAPQEPQAAQEQQEAQEEDGEEDNEASTSQRRRGRRGTRRSTRTTSTPSHQRDDKTEAPHDDEDEDLPDEPVALKGSTRLEAQRRRRSEMREKGQHRSKIVSQAEFLARRESVNRTMVVRERPHVEDPSKKSMITQVGVLEDDLLVEHFVTSEEQSSIIGNIYLGRVQNVLPSMEAAFIDIGKGRNGVLYASEVDWKSAGLRGGARKIEQALKSGDQVVVQVSKDPVGHKGARLTTQISLAGRYLVYVPGGRSAGISRKLPAPERKRLKEILARVIPGHGGAIIRTAAENVPEDAIQADVDRLHGLWEDVQREADKEKKSKGAKPVALYEEPDILVKVVRDLFNEDFSALVVDGKKAWSTVSDYVHRVAPDLADRLEKYNAADHDGEDAFAHYRVDEQLQKALGRKVWLPSGGSLVIDRTEAMTVIDVNTGKFTGSGGNLEETVTRNNLEAAEEIVRQMRLRDMGGMIVVDFIDMVLEDNQDLVLRRLKEALGRDRTRHQVSEVTSLGLVQMTRKRLGTGLLETFSNECEHCGGRGLILHDDPVELREEDDEREERRSRSRTRVQTPHRPEDKGPKLPKPADDKELEALAESVIVTDSEDDDSEEPEEKQSPRRSSRRRGGRGRSRGRGRQEHRDRDESVAEVQQIAEDAVDTADQAEPEEAKEQSYEQAVAEFDASPRRRRRTRGNSRSDHRPRREDFEQKDEPEQKQQRSGEGSVDKDKEATTTRGTRRGRRRAVRRSSTQKQPQATKRTQPKENKENKERKEPEKKQQPASGGRQRRRATRRRARK